jgi:hypothetical protein
MNWQSANETVLEAREAMATLNHLLRGMDPDKVHVTQLHRDKLRVCMRGMDKCWTYMPEITERDDWMDTYWDKIDAQEDAKKFGESMENEVRLQVYERKFRDLLAQAHGMLAKADPDEYDEYRCAMLEAEQMAMYE